MTREMTKRIPRVNLNSAGNQFIYQCAPLLVGLRISALLVVPNGHLGQIQVLLQGSRFWSYLLYRDSERTTLLLYCRRELEKFLSGRFVKDFLEEEGYDTSSLPDILGQFCVRYGQYRRGQAEFPHELGVILGYPLEDVRGYIHNQGRNSLYTGYWKVYRDVSQKRALFRMFELSKEMFLVLLYHGVSAQELIRRYDK